MDLPLPASRGTPAGLDCGEPPQYDRPWGMREGADPRGGDVAREQCLLLAAHIGEIGGQDPFIGYIVSFYENRSRRYPTSLVSRISS